MTDHLSKCKIKKLFLMLLVLILPIILCFCAAEDGPTPTEISSAVIQNDKNTVKVTATLSDEDYAIYKGEKLVIISLTSLGESDGASVVAKSKAKSKMTFDIKIDEQSESFVSSPIALAKVETHEITGEESFTLITELEAINNVGYIAKSSITSPTGKEIKGLESDDVTKALSMGASQVLFEVRINDFLLAEYEEGAINFLFDGNTYYFDSNELEALDKKVREATLQGQKVYLRTVISAPGGENCVESLYFGTVTSRRTEGFAINAQNNEAMSCLRAFYSFIGERYSNSNMPVADYIIGRAVNNYGINCHAPDAEAFENAYFIWLTTAANILRTYNKSAQVYVSVDNNLRTESSSAVGAKSFLTALAVRTQQAGGLDFSVALTLSDGEDIGDILSGSNKDITTVNANSFSMLTELLSTTEMLYRGESREVIIDSLSLPKSISEQNRAAYYTYTYYKALDAGFNAIFYNENRPGSDMLDESGKRGELYNAISLCGTDKYNELYAYLGRVHATEIPKLADYLLLTTIYDEDVPCTVQENVTKSSRSFPAELSALLPIGSAFDAHISSDKTSSILTLSSSLDDGSAALILSDISGKDIIESGYIGISMSCPYVSDIELILYTDGEKGRVLYTGTARVGSVDKTYYFNVAEFTDNIKESDRIVLMLRLPDDAENCEDQMTITDISLFGSSGNGSQTIKASIVVAVSSLVICALLFLLTQKRKKKRSRHSSRVED